MEKYHMRRTERVMGAQEIQEVIDGQQVMTLAMCKDGEPYLSSVNYGYDKDSQCFYFHCAKEGKKIDFLKANPTVYGQVLEDIGYIQGQCDHTYRTVQFEGVADFIEDLDEKKKILALMINQLERDPNPVKERLILDKKVLNVGIGRVKVESFSGKKGMPGKGG